MKNEFVRLTLAFFLTCSLLSCQTDTVFDQSDSFAAIGGWPQKKKVTYSFDIQDTSRSYELHAAIRQAQDYPYYNVYFIPKIEDEKGQIIKRAFVEAFLYDPKTGKPKGSGMGDIYSHTYTLFSGLRFPHAGKYRVSFEQYMRTDTLKGIVSVGASLLKNP